MEQTVASPTLASTNNPTNVSDTLTIPDRLIAPPASAVKKSSILGRISFLNQPHIFSSKLHPSDQQSDAPQKGREKIHGSYPVWQKRRTPAIFSEINTEHIRPSRGSIGEGKLTDIIQELKENPVEEEAFEEEMVSVTGYWKWIGRSRKFLGHSMVQPRFHYVIISLIIFDLVLVFVDLVLAQLSLPCLTDVEMEQYNTTEQRPECLLVPTHSVEVADLFLFYASLVLISIFVLEILTACYAFGWRRYTKVLYLLDAVIVFASFVMEVIFHFGGLGKAGRAAAGIVVLRLWKIVRAIHAIAHSISLRNQMIIEEIQEAQDMLKEEKLSAEKIIHGQQCRIEYLTNLLEQAGRQVTSAETDTVTCDKTESVNSITLF